MFGTLIQLRNLQCTSLVVLRLHSVRLLFLLSIALCLPIQSVSAKRLLLFPFQAPHLSTSQLNKQTKILYKQVKKIKGLKITSLKRTRRLIRRQKFALTLLKKPKSAQWSVKRLCYTLKSDYALSVSMKLGTDTKPAKLVAVLFRCRDSSEKIDYMTLPFEGKLSKRVWRILSEDIEETLTSPEPKRRSKPSFRTGTEPPLGYQSPNTQNRFNSYPNLPSQASPTPPPVSQNPPNLGMTAPIPMYPETMSRPGYTDQVDPSLNTRLPMEDPSSSVEGAIEASGLQIFAGGRMLTKAITYTTQADTRSLQGGLRYESQWLSGWGAQILTRPSRSRRLSIYGEYERYEFTSFRMVNNLFTVPGIEETKSLALQSSLQRWSGGLRYAYPIRTKSLVHQGGIQVVYQGSLMDIETNTDFLGLDMHQAEFGIFGEFIITPERFYLGLNTGFYPFVYLGNRSQEFGKTAESYGINSKINFRYRSNDGLSLNFYFKLDFTFIDPSGEGRDGRFGKSARDQTISFGLDLGYCSQP